jgi:hypothetical protein
LIEKYGIPQFIKIDVEGYELEVLKGLSHPINAISFEYTVPEQAEKLVTCIKRIEELDGKTLFNYSIGESMELVFQKWYTADRLIEHVNSKEFEKSS